MAITDYHGLMRKNRDVKGVEMDWDYAVFRIHSTTPSSGIITRLAKKVTVLRRGFPLDFRNGSGKLFHGARLSIHHCGS